MLTQDSPLTDARRIAIVGIGGSGKSTLAFQIAARTKLPLFHMDQLFWRPGWDEIPEAEYLPKHAALVAQETWIIEGFVDRAMRDRTERADLVIWLDYGRFTCLFRVIRRWWQHRLIARPELSPDMLEDIAFRFWWTVFTRSERHGIVHALERVPPEHILIFHTPHELAAFMAEA